MRSVPIAVSDDLAVKIGGRRMLSLSPGEAFEFAEALIRSATRAIVIEEADRVAVLDTVRAAEAGEAAR